MKHVHILAALPIAIALGSGCSTFHGYETTLPGDSRPNADVGGPYRIVELTSNQVGLDGTMMLHPFYRGSCSGASMTRYLAERYPGTFSSDDSATPLVVQLTVAHEHVTCFFQSLAGVLTLGSVPAKAIERERMTAAFMLPSEETTEPFPWEVRLKRLYNVNPLAAGFLTAEKGWYSGYPREAPSQRARGTPDPMIVADFSAAWKFNEKVRNGTATKADQEDSDERSFWSRVSSATGSARLREYAGAAVIEALNRLSPEERAALKNNAVAREAQNRLASEKGGAPRDSIVPLSTSTNISPLTLITDYPVRKPDVPLGRDALVGTWKGHETVDIIHSGDSKKTTSPVMLRHHTYEFKSNGKYVATSFTASSGIGSGEGKSEGTWSYADGKLTIMGPPLPGSKTKTTFTTEVAWFGRDEIQIRQIPFTKDETFVTTTTTVGENGCFTTIIRNKAGDIVTTIRGTPIELKRK